MLGFKMQVHYNYVRLFLLPRAKSSVWMQGQRAVNKRQFYDRNENGLDVCRCSNFKQVCLKSGISHGKERCSEVKVPVCFFLTAGKVKHKARNNFAWEEKKHLPQTRNGN